MKNYRLSIDVVKLAGKWPQDAFPTNHGKLWIFFIQIDATEFTESEMVIGSTKRSPETIQINFEKLN